MRAPSLIFISFLSLTACSEHARYPTSAGMGPHPALPPPTNTLIPTVNIAPAKGWPAGGKPTPGEHLQVGAFADQLDHPRWLYVLPNGDVLVAETNAPPKPEDAKGIKGWFMKYFMKKAGAVTLSANRITLLRDENGDGVADFRSIFLQGLHSPFGMALVGNDFYVANTDAVVRFPYQTGQTRITESPVVLAKLPAGPINHHWTKNLTASRDGKKLYASIGSNSNVAENGLKNEFERAAIWEIDRYTGMHRVYSSGLRNPVGMAYEPASGALWVAVNERDELGSDLVPDYMTAVHDNGFYGWPYSYYGQHVDERVKPARPDLVARAIVPDYALGAHTASLGLYNSEGSQLPNYSHGMFVGQHGSWNRKPHSGYKVIFIPFCQEKPCGNPVDILSGFLDSAGNAQGRPVGVAIDRKGGLLVADDVGNTIWRVTALTP